MFVNVVGKLVNFDNVKQVYMDQPNGRTVVIQMLDDTFIKETYDTSLLAQSALDSYSTLVQSSSGGAGIQLFSITPTTDASGSIFAVIKGQGLESGGTVALNATGLNVTFIDSTTLFVFQTAPVAPGVYDVNYSRPASAVTDAQLPAGFTVT